MSMIRRIARLGATDRKRLCIEIEVAEPAPTSEASPTFELSSGPELGTLFQKEAARRLTLNCRWLAGGTLVQEKKTLAPEKLSRCSTWDVVSALCGFGATHPKCARPSTLGSCKTPLVAGPRRAL